MPNPTLSVIRTGGLGAVRAVLQYMQPQDEPPFCVMYPRLDGGPQMNCEFDEVAVDIADARRFAFPPTLESAGFELHHAPTETANLLDDADVRATYYPELVELALLSTGGTAAMVFDHMVRQREEDRRALTYGRHGKGLVGPSGRVHNDYSEASGRRRLIQVFNERLPDVLERRHCIVNIWRPIGHPVFDTPLALCDARSVPRDDLIATELRYSERTGEAYQVLYRPSHRWAYFDRLAPDEAIVFKQYDSAINVARFTPHAAFDLPQVPPNTPLRTSIEARVAVVF